MVVFLCFLLFSKKIGKFQCGKDWSQMFCLIIIYNTIASTPVRKISLRSQSNNCDPWNQSVFKAILVVGLIKPTPNQIRIFDTISIDCLWVNPSVFTQGQYWPSGFVVACVCLCVRPCVNHELVRAITRDPFQLGSPNLDHRCKRPWLRSLLFWGVIDLDLQGQIKL